MIVRQSLLKVCKWVLRNSNWDAVSLETIMINEVWGLWRFEGVSCFTICNNNYGLRVLRVMRVYEGKYLSSLRVYYWFCTLNTWRTLNTTYTCLYYKISLISLKMLTFNLAIKRLYREAYVIGLYEYKLVI